MISFESTRNLPLQPFDRLKTLFNKYSFTGLAGVTLLALAGYAFLLLFPLLVFVGVLNIYKALALSNEIAWQTATFWLFISVIAGLVSYRCTQYKPSPPIGLTLIEEKAPELFKLVQQIRIHFKRPAIHRIVITSNYELDIIKTPQWALPAWSLNTMVIGLPILQCLTTRQFECMVARRIGQFSKRENLLTNWLYQLRAIWPQYHLSYSKQKGPGTEPLKWFFSVYASLYRTLTVNTARRDELKADIYAMELYRDDEVLEMITTDTVCRYYLHKRYWPAVYKIAEIQTKTLPAPHSKMAAAVLASLEGEKLAELVEEAVKEETDRKDPVPPLQTRIKNIGHDQAHMEKPTGKIAATHYLGTNATGVIDLVDKLWLKTFIEDRKKQHPKKNEHAAITQATNP